MGEVRNLISSERAAAAGMLGPTEHPGLEERAIHDELTAAFEKVEQAHLSVGPEELVRFLNRHPRHSPPLGGQRIAGSGQSLLLHQELLTRRVPVLSRHDWGI